MSRLRPHGGGAMGMGVAPGAPRKFSMTSKKARAIRQYDGDEIRIKMGETITIIGIAEDGWLAGTNGECLGSFPADVVELIQVDTTANENEINAAKQAVRLSPPSPGSGRGAPLAGPSKHLPHPVPRKLPAPGAPSSPLAHSSSSPSVSSVPPATRPPAPPSRKAPSPETVSALPHAAPKSPLPPLPAGTKKRGPPPGPPPKARPTPEPQSTPPGRSPPQAPSSNASPRNVDSLTSKQRHREEVIREILTTERDYVKDLDVLVAVFVIPLRAMSVLPEAEIVKLFSNVEMFTAVNSQMLQELEKRVAEAPATGACVGDVFKLMSNFLKMYNVYCSQYYSAIAFLETLEKNVSFKHFLDICHTDDRCRGLSLQSYLIKPVQRICKYPLLLKELLNDTDTDHPDYEALVEAQKKVSEVANFINEETRRAEKARKLLQIQATVDGCIPLVAPTRTFVREDVFKMEKNQAHVFLFNDMIVVAAEKSFAFMRGSGLEFKAAFSLAKARLVVVADTDAIVNAVQLLEDKQNYTLSLPTSAERDAWVKEVRALIKDIQKKKLQDLRGSAHAAGSPKTQTLERASYCANAPKPGAASTPQLQRNPTPQETSREEEEERGASFEARHRRRHSTGSSLLPRPDYEVMGVPKPTPPPRSPQPPSRPPPRPLPART